MISTINIILLCVAALAVLLLLICLCIPLTRCDFVVTVQETTKTVVDLFVDFSPAKGPFLFNLLIWIFLIPVALFFVVVVILLGPLSSLWNIRELKEMWNTYSGNLETPSVSSYKDVKDKRPVISNKNSSSSFVVNRNDLQYDPDEHEILFYSPVPAPEVESAITAKLVIIKELCVCKGYYFVFLPDFNESFNANNEIGQLKYYNPRFQTPIQTKTRPLSYQDIKEALQIPYSISNPCFIRCKNSINDRIPFSVCPIELAEHHNILSITIDYLSKVGKGGPLYSIASQEKIQESLAGLPADDRFDSDVYLIGQEIRDRIDQLRTRGLSSLAIRNLIGDDSDKPSRLFIDRHNKLFLTDYDNKEIKLSPIHKAVFFLFLNHPEGIYFKNLPDYKNELESIYGKVTGRLDPEGIGDSIDRLTNPLDNSINEKCARIKNAFVSEFREEVAQWYFIDGRKGERKLIKLPRDLVTWQK